jgi:hypothetical protein
MDLYCDRRQSKEINQANQSMARESIQDRATNIRNCSHR